MVDTTSIPKVCYLLNADRSSLQHFGSSFICSFNNYFMNFSSMLGNKLYQSKIIVDLSSINQIIWSTPALTEGISMSLQMI